MVRVPCTFGSSTTFKPLISWIRRKKSRRSTSFRFTEIGSPVYFGVDVTTAVGVCAASAITACAGIGADIGAGAETIIGADAGVAITGAGAALEASTTA